jgi:hypothetical protein
MPVWQLEAERNRHPATEAVLKYGTQLHPIPLLPTQAWEQMRVVQPQFVADQ